MNRLSKAALLLVLAVFSAGTFVPAAAQSLPPAKAPTVKSARVETLKLSPDAAATPIVLPAPAPAAVDNVKRANAGVTLKRLQIGLARPAPATAHADSAALDWLAVEGGFAARWTVTSTEAKALRVGIQVKRSHPTLELRFSSASRPDVVYGPFTEADINSAAGKTYWSPVLEGDTAIVELFVKGDAAPRGLSVKIAQVSHLIANPADPKVELQLKQAAFCEVNFVCLAASDAALQATGEAVARMAFSDSTGGTFLCTGTLLNSSGGQFVPYFYSADHCIDSQAVASTLTTYWFYESLSCGSDSVNPNYVQVGGGATLLYADQSTDVSFMRLNRAQPSNATFAGWDASTLSTGTPLTAIHHPDGDVKKVSLGTMGGFVTDPPQLAHPNGSFIKSNWNSISTGVTEGGSSGSGIFTHANGDYSFRGGLLGGPSGCFASASELNDYYSRFDVAYPKISQYLGAATSANNYTALWYNSPAESESGWGINITHEGDIVFATLFTYDTDGRTPLWLVMSRGVRQGSADTFTGALYRTTGSPFDQAFQGTEAPQQVGAMTIAFTGPSSANLSYSVNGTSVSKAITKELFSPTGAICQNTTGSRASATNYTDLWWNAPESSEAGWGINITHQGNIIFATLFTYRSDHQGVWFVMSRGDRQADGSFSGPLYQMSGKGGAFNAAPFPGATPNQVGTMTLRFSDGEHGTLTYSVNNANVTKQIVREVFSTPVPLCTG